MRWLLPMIKNHRCYTTAPTLVTLKTDFRIMLINVLDTTVTGPLILAKFCRVKFLTNERIRVVFPTFGGPTSATIKGGGSRGVRSIDGI